MTRDSLKRRRLSERQLPAANTATRFPPGPDASQHPLTSPEPCASSGAPFRAAPARAGAPGHPRGPEPTRRGILRGYEPLPCSGGSRPAAGRSHTATATSRRAGRGRQRRSWRGREGRGRAQGGSGGRHPPAPVRPGPAPAAGPRRRPALPRAPAFVAGLPVSGVSPGSVPASCRWLETPPVCRLRALNVFFWLTVFLPTVLHIARSHWWAADARECAVFTSFYLHCTPFGGELKLCTSGSEILLTNGNLSSNEIN